MVLFLRHPHSGEFVILNGNSTTLRMKLQNAWNPPIPSTILGYNHQDMCRSMVFHRDSSPTQCTSSLPGDQGSAKKQAAISFSSCAFAPVWAYLGHARHSVVEQREPVAGRVEVEHELHLEPERQAAELKLATFAFFEPASCCHRGHCEGRGPRFVGLSRGVDSGQESPPPLHYLTS